MDLPTYTNIWRIEKRLYKLYDFRLPAPLPINWIAVFTGITVPYIVLLVAIGLPFNHTLVWLYVLPPGLLTWLTTRPVIESKRLPELLESQIRYLTEPRVWCRLVPLGEKDHIVVTARVWHSRRAPRQPGENQRREVAAVALRERGTVVRRNRRPVTVDAAHPVASAASASAGAATSVEVDAPAKASRNAGATGLRARARGKTTGASSGAVRARSAESRLPAEGRPAGPRPAVQSRPAVEPWLAIDPRSAARPRSASGPWPDASPGPAGPSAPAPDQAAKPGRFWLAALRSHPAGPAPALPPGVAVKPPATAGRTRSEAPAQPAQLPEADRGLAAVAAALAPDVPVHATADVPSPPRPPRERPAGKGAPRIEVSHGGSDGTHWYEQRERMPADVSQASAAMTRQDADKSVPPPAPPPPPAAPQSPAAPPPMAGRQQPAVPHVTAITQPDQRTPSIERALSGPSKDRNLSWHGKVRIVTGAPPGPGAPDQEALDRARARLPLNGPKRVLMLGCTSGAGQTVTTLMTGHILASLREQPVAVVDLHDGTLAGYSALAPAGWTEEILRGETPDKRASSAPDGMNPARGDAAARLDVIASGESLGDGDERLLAERLGVRYPLAVLDPGAVGLTKLLTITDQLVVVVPASVEAAAALADTRDWLDAHGFADLAAHSVTLVNGVSKRSMADVAQAESVARGRCRAIVRVPWDDMLPAGLTGPSAFRPQTRVSYTALAGVLVAGMAAAPIRKKQ